MSINQNAAYNFWTTWKARIISVFILATGIISIFIFPPSSFEKLIAQIQNLLISTGLISIIYSLFLRRSFLQEAKNILIESEREKEDLETLIKTANKNGLISICENLPIDSELKDLVRSNKSEIRILDTYIGNDHAIFPIIRSALSKGASVKILILNPNDDIKFSSRRSIEFYQNRRIENKVQERINQNIYDLKKIKKEFPDLEIKQYKSTPVFTIHLIGNISYIGFFWTGNKKERSGKGNAAAANIQLKINMKKSNPLARRIKNHFNEIWKYHSEEIN